MQVDEPTDWVNSFVIIEKRDHSLRLCLDPKVLNLNIRREHFQIPTFADVSNKLGGSNLFTILNQKDSYWQVKVDVASSLLTAFNTLFGRYRFVTDVHIIADDMLITSKIEAEHDATLRKVLERARSQGMKFNKAKIQLKMPEVFYMGTHISKEGIRPSKPKIKAIVQIPEPVDKDGVRRLIGMLNYLSPFIPN